MSLKKLLDNLNPQIIGSLKRAIELGRWPSGDQLSGEQRALCVQAVARWELQYLPAESRSGYVAPKAAACEHTQEVEQKLHWV
jgi:hypothetical protein